MFGREKLTQVQCPKCAEWQFREKKCSSCDLNFTGLHLTKQKPTEYRSEISGRPRIGAGLRKNIYVRDEFICQYCGVHCFDSWIDNPDSLTIDHMIPVSLGGNNDEDNLVTCCSECNSYKSSLSFTSFDEARERILKHKKDYILH